MREFFRGWKRKAGCATLVIACVISLLWLRSTVLGDYLTIGRFAIVSQDGLVSCADNLTDERLSLETVEIDGWEMTTGPDGTPMLGVGHVWLHFADRLAYSSLAIPLTIISACLIFGAAVESPDKSKTHRQ